MHKTAREASKSTVGTKDGSAASEQRVAEILAAANDLTELKLALESNDLALQSLRSRLVAVEDAAHRVELQAAQPSFVWCIDDFGRRFSQARAGQQDRLVSQPFRLGPDSYLMRMSACLFGESAVRGRCLSVFVCFLPGEFDSLLEWPFNRRMYITALDLTGSGRHHSRVLIPGRAEAGSNRSYLRRPTGGPSPWFGVRNFLELVKLENGGRFVRGNQLHLRLEVPTEEPLVALGK